MKWKIAKLSAWLVVVAVSSAQGPPAGTTQPAGADGGVSVAPPVRDPPEKTLEFPFGEGVGRGDVIVIPVKIGGKEHLFFVDTGCSTTAIDSTLAQTLKDTLGAPLGKINIQSVQGGKTESLRYRPPALEAGGQRLKNKGIYVMIMDLEQFRQALGRPIQGILGWDVLSQYVVRLDFRRHKFELIDPQNLQALPNNAAKSFAIIETNDHPCITFPFAGIPDALVTIDTGCVDVGVISRQMLKMIPPAEIIETTSRQGLDVSGSTVAKYVTIKQKWSIEDTVFENMPFMIASVNVIGLRTLADFVVTLDFPQKQAYFQSIRPQHAPELLFLEFGIGLKDGRVIVYNLNENVKSLDIQVGDQILAVDGKDVSKTELWALREQLQKAKAPVVRLRRKDETHDVTMHHE